jgi:DNA polymerase III subunit epsilon
VNFIALDVETANPDLASICQVGIVEFQNGKIASELERLVNPEDYFDGMNVLIHGIEEKDVEGQPTWQEIHEYISDLLTGKIVVSHTAFDRTSLLRACEKYRVKPIECTWLDSARVVRRTWTDFSKSGYGLSSVADALGIEFKHHNAKEDARAAGEILVRAIQHSQVSLSEWLIKSQRPIGAENGSTAIRREGNQDGPLFGEIIVFTGALTISRREAADLAAQAGCEVIPSVNRTTTLLVVGDQDIQKLAGHDKSTKHRKAEALIAKGQNIRILRESDFQKLLSLKW